MSGSLSGSLVSADVHGQEDAAAARARAVQAAAARGLQAHPDRLEVRTSCWDRGGCPVVSPRDAARRAGAALFDARVALAASGWAVEIDRLPSTDDADLLATVRPVEGAPDAAAAVLAGARPPSGQAALPVPDDVLADLVAAAAAEGTVLVPVVREHHLHLVHRLLQLSQGREPPQSWEPGAGTAMLLTSHRDDIYGWLRSGEACRRILLELARRGWRAAPTTRPVELPVARTQLRSALAWDTHPQTLLLVGA